MIMNPAKISFNAKPAGAEKLKKIGLRYKFTLMKINLHHIF